jgi:hypothetical protein
VGATGPAGPTAKQGGPSGANDREVDVVNNGGQDVSFTEYTICGP